jgi:hypothetical protein
MKRPLLIVAVGWMLFLFSCGGSEAANKMAEEMCIAMEKYKVEEPMTMLDAANEMSNIRKNTEAYGKVTDAQLKKAMMKKCPEGWKKYEVLKGK